MEQFDIPVLLLIFNRPDTTAVVFDAIRNIKPAKLFIAADGPRHNDHNDEESCILARQITMHVDWPCEVHRLFRDENLGCGRAPASGISWFFERVDKGIILEDDINPSPDFFWFCKALLEHYHNDYRVMEIGGVNLMADKYSESSVDYHFSNHNHTWGWATWKRAWKHYDFSISRYTMNIVQQFLQKNFNSKLEHAYFKRLFDATYYKNHTVTWWDYQWEFARRINSGLSIVPSTNLIANIGLGKHATHTLDEYGIGADLKWGQIKFPLKHPPFIMADWEKDYQYFRTNFSTLASRMRFNLERLIPHYFRKSEPAFEF